MRNTPRFASRAALLPLALALLLAAGHGLAADAPAADILHKEEESPVGKPRGIDVIPAAPDAQKKPLPRAKRIQVKGPDGKNFYVYKCGDEFTDSPVCGPNVKPSTMRPSADEMSRCKTLKNGNFIPWYCR